MNTSEIERLVVEALHTDAEAAMSKADAPLQIEHLVREARREESRRRGWIAGAALVAAAAAAAAVIWWPSSTDPHPAPVDSPDSTGLTSAEKVATDFVAAYQAYDWEQVSAALAEDADVLMNDYQGTRALRLQLDWERVVGRALSLDGCFETETHEDGSVRVGCLYTLAYPTVAGFSTERFSDNSIDLTVRDGRVVAVSQSGGPDWNTRWVVPFNAWLDDAHPDDVALLIAARDPRSDRATIERSLERWREIFEEYGSAVLAGDVG